MSNSVKTRPGTSSKSHKVSQAEDSVGTLQATILGDTQEVPEACNVLVITPVNTSHANIPGSPSSKKEKRRKKTKNTADAQSLELQSKLTEASSALGPPIFKKLVKQDRNSGKKKRKGEDHVIEPLDVDSVELLEGFNSKLEILNAPYNHKTKQPFVSPCITKKPNASEIKKAAKAERREAKKKALEIKILQVLQEYPVLFENIDYDESAAPPPSHQKTKKELKLERKKLKAMKKAAEKQTNVEAEGSCNVLTGSLNDLDIAKGARTVSSDVASQQPCSSMQSNCIPQQPNPSDRLLGYDADAEQAIYIHADAEEVPAKRRARRRKTKALRKKALEATGSKESPDMEMVNPFDVKDQTKHQESQSERNVKVKDLFDQCGGQRAVIDMPGVPEVLHDAAAASAGMSSQPILQSSGLSANAQDAPSQGKIPSAIRIRSSTSQPAPVAKPSLKSTLSSATESNKASGNAKPSTIQSSKLHPNVQALMSIAGNSTTTTNAKQMLIQDDGTAPTGSKKTRNRKKSRERVKARKEAEKKLQQVMRAEMANASIEDVTNAQQNTRSNSKQATEDDLKFFLREDITPCVKDEQSGFYCKPCCSYHVSVLNTYKHIKQDRHIANKRNAERDIMLHALEPPCTAHSDAVTQVVNDVVQRVGLTDQELSHMAQCVAELQSFMQKHRPELHLMQYGSTVSGFGLRGCNVNVSVFGATSPTVLCAIKELITKDDTGQFQDIVSDFSAIIPTLSFTYKHCNIELVYNSIHACHTARYLALYSKCDKRVKPLAVALRHWAKLIHIDDQKLGSLPAYAFDILVIYFLQELPTEVLPVLCLPDNEKYAKMKSKDVHILLDALEATTCKAWQSRNRSSIGKLFVLLLRYYAVEVTLSATVVQIHTDERAEHKSTRWANKRISIEDPFVRSINMARTISHVRISEFIYDHFKTAYAYFGVSTKKRTGQKVNPKKTKHNKAAPAASNLTPGKVSNTASSGVTRAQSLRCDSTGSDVTADSSHRDSVFTVESPNVSISDVMINHRSLEDNDSSVLDDMNAQLEGLCAGVQQLFDFSRLHSEISSGIEADNIGGNSEGGGQYMEDSSSSTDGQSSDSEETEDDSPLQDIEDGVSESDYYSDSESDDSLVYEYKFDARNFWDGKAPEIFCAFCSKEGHTKTACPENKLLPLKPLPPLTATHIETLNQTLLDVRYEYQPTAKFIEHRNMELKCLENYICKEFPTASLSLFGSSVNGFGFNFSDMDISMEQARYPDGLEDEEKRKAITKLAKLLRRCQMVYNVTPITTAKVPIVKFCHRALHLEGDISMENQLGMYNSQLLKTYSVIDDRVVTLGFTMKYFAKTCDICDASKGSLSSYAYTLMVIYFLQQRNPPVIPVLQELYEGEKPKVMVGEWNAWFYRDIGNLRKVWPAYGKNKESLGELWVGLLRFYTEEFRIRDTVISIRQQKPLSRFEKLWNGQCFAVEDPFDLNHNLGRSLSLAMNMYTIKAFRNGRERFGTVPQVEELYQYACLTAYFMNPEALIQVSRPTGRGCHYCYKLDHRVKNCPELIHQNRVEQQGQQKASYRDQAMKQQNQKGNGKQHHQQPPANASQQVRQQQSRQQPRLQQHQPPKHQPPRLQQTPQHKPQKHNARHARQHNSQRQVQQQHQRASALVPGSSAQVQQPLLGPHNIAMIRKSLTGNQTSPRNTPPAAQHAIGVPLLMSGQGSGGYMQPRGAPVPGGYGSPPPNVYGQSPPALPYGQSPQCRGVGRGSPQSGHGQSSPYGSYAQSPLQPHNIQRRDSSGSDNRSRQPQHFDQMTPGTSPRK